jgi:EAL domain-containing protein (putative c-di-GMP-specific phosphodiesterase class I)
VKPKSTNAWTARLQTALEKNTFELVYQPIVNLHGEPAEYFEVLVRLIGENGESIAAGQFMQAAEDCGLGPAIDRWVTENAIAALRELHREDRRATFFINLCPASFREPDLIIQTQKHLAAANLKPKYLSFEADEEAILAAPAEARTFMQAAKKLGCRFCVDNFGNNMSNLNQLRDLPIDCLKIAGVHVQNLSSDAVAQASFKALIHVAKALEKQIIAKSVERAEDLAILWNLGVDYVQGHYFQEAEAHLGYEFGGEATLSSEPQSPNWATASKR